jgi:predicted RNA binding protein YcfA (HicA-like mRNA interferase family)
VPDGKLPVVTAGQTLRALLRAGWYVKREGGNHQILSHADKGGRVTLSRHPSETLKPKTLKSILDQAGLTPDEFRNLL